MQSKHLVKPSVTPCGDLRRPAFERKPSEEVEGSTEVNEERNSYKRRQETFLIQPNELKEILFTVSKS